MAIAKKYRVLALSWIGNRLVQPGDVVEYAGKPGSNLEELKEPKAPKASDPSSPDGSDDSPL